MRFNPAAFTTSVLLLLACSCSIIQDSDIKSAAEVKNLALQTIIINQQTNAGAFSTVMLPLVDKTVSISTAAGMITRYIEMSVPATGTTNKLRFRTAVVPGSRAYAYYFSNGKPSTFGIYKQNVVSGVVKDSTFYEVYRFRYDAAGKLTKFTTFLSPCCATPTTNDTLIYSGNKVTSITRKAPADPSKAGTITVSYDGPSVSMVSYELSPSKKYTYQGNGCFTCNSDSYSSLTYTLSSQGINSGSSGGGGGSLSNITLTNLYGKPQTITMEDQRNNGSGSGFAPDIYYFHPMMLLNGDLTSGMSLFHIYMVDLWQQGAQSTGSTGNNTNEFVNFTFNYAKK